MEAISPQIYIGKVNNVSVSDGGEEYYDVKPVDTKICQCSQNLPETRKKERCGKEAFRPKSFDGEGLRWLTGSKNKKKI